MAYSNPNSIYQSQLYQNQNRQTQQSMQNNTIAQQRHTQQLCEQQRTQAAANHANCVLQQQRQQQQQAAHFYKTLSPEEKTFCVEDDALYFYMTLNDQEQAFYKTLQNNSWEQEQYRKANSPAERSQTYITILNNREATAVAEEKKRQFSESLPKEDKPFVDELFQTGVKLYQEMSNSEKSYYRELPSAREREIYLSLSYTDRISYTKLSSKDRVGYSTRPETLSNYLDCLKTPIASRAFYETLSTEERIFYAKLPADCKVFYETLSVSVRNCFRSYGFTSQDIEFCKTLSDKELFDFGRLKTEDKLFYKRLSSSNEREFYCTLSTFSIFSGNTSTWKYQELSSDIRNLINVTPWFLRTAVLKFYLRSDSKDQEVLQEIGSGLNRIRQKIPQKIINLLEGTDSNAIDYYTLNKIGDPTTTEDVMNSCQKNDETFKLFFQQLCGSFIQAKILFKFYTFASTSDLWNQGVNKQALNPYRNLPISISDLQLQALATLLLQAGRYVSELDESDVKFFPRLTSSKQIIYLVLTPEERASYKSLFASNQPDYQPLDREEQAFLDSLSIKTRYLYWNLTPSKKEAYRMMSNEQRTQYADRRVYQDRSKHELFACSRVEDTNCNFCLIS